jgi:hypothetical protein
MKSFLLPLAFLLIFQYSNAQNKDQLSSKVSVAVNTNLETYFFAEKLAVERIDNFVFDHKDWDYSHQPIVYYGFQNFKKHNDDPVIIRIADILKQLRETYHDNGPIMNYMVNQKEFPEKGPLFIQSKYNADYPAAAALLVELTDSLRKFYVKANVGMFLKKNAVFYRGALKEVEKDVDVSSFPAMEKWYGKKFSQYHIYLAPSMPITSGEDNYRGFGPQIISAEGTIPSMIISSDKMLPFQSNLTAYHHFGFDNQAVTHMLTKHEIGHSFVNPEMEKYASQIKSDSILFTPGLKSKLAPYYINDWYICVIEHLVRLGEIRTAVMMNDYKEVHRLRLVHIGQYKCVLLPLLEDKINEYENNRVHYPSFESYLPKLIAYFHSLSPQIVNDQVKKYENYRQK